MMIIVPNLKLCAEAMENAPAMLNTTGEEVWGAKTQITTKRSVDQAKSQILRATQRKVRKNGHEGELAIDDLQWESERDWIKGYVTRSMLELRR